MDWMLLWIESNTDVSPKASQKPLVKESFNWFSRSAIAYHARYCYEANLIKDFSIGGNSESVFASDLTPKGHDFLSNIRENKIWNGVKIIAGKVGSSSLDALIQISTNVITELIKAQFGIGITSP